jgi:hypothetical protein
MTKEQALYQSLAASCAAVITFIGVCHGAVGAALFPFGPAFFGGLFLWYAAGIALIIVGLALLAATLRLIRFPVVATGLLMAPVALALTVFVAVVHGQFHMFAVTLALCGLLMAYCHHKGGQLLKTAPAP